MALIGIFLQKYGLDADPGKGLPNTKLDADYLALLHYADGLASDETAGDMATMCGWLFGSDKKRISSTRLLSSIPSEVDIRFGAYCQWVFSGQTHGHDVVDWLSSESALYEETWNNL